MKIMNVSKLYMYVIGLYFCVVNCWPSESSGKCEVNIEYELQHDDMELQDVQITIPIPLVYVYILSVVDNYFMYSGGVGAPTVASCDGEYKHDSKKNILTWSLPVIDESNKNGSMEFAIPGRSDDFFPVHVCFSSPRSYCDIQVGLAHKFVIWGTSEQ